MIRVEPRKAGAYEGQRRHDLRLGRLPGYVDEARVPLNEVVRTPPRAATLRALNETRRAGREGLQRAMRKDTAPAWVGVLGLGADAQAIVARLTPEQQRAGFVAAADAAARVMRTTCEGLVIHRDESALHAHATFAAYDAFGKPLTATVKRSTLTKLQDAVAEAWKRFAPGVERGRRTAADRFAEDVHKTMREMRAELPADLAAARAEVAAAREKADEMRTRVALLHDKAERSEKETKRLRVYEERLQKRVAALEDAETAAARLATLTQEAEAARADLKRAACALNMKAAALPDASPDKAEAARLLNGAGRLMRKHTPPAAEPPAAADANRDPEQPEQPGTP